MKKASIAFIITVLAACAMPVVLMLCGVKNANRENRPLAQLPALIGEDGALNLDFPSGFDKYVNDHFALREHIVTACNTATVGLLGDYNGESAIIGRDGTLLYAETAGDHLGTNLLSGERIASAADYLCALQAELNAQGRQFVFIVAPNKATIYPEYMPGRLRPVDGSRNIDALQNALAERGVCFIDARALLTEAKHAYDRPVYYLRDSHWNNLGAALVFNAIAGELGLEHVDETSFMTANDYSGDLVNFVYPSAPHYEERLVYSFKHEYSPVGHMVNFDMFKENETESDANDAVLLVYHDSFGKSLQPFLSSACGRLVMLKSNSPSYRIEDAEACGADFVVIELVERNLDLMCEYAVKNGY